MKFLPLILITILLSIAACADLTKEAPQQQVQGETPETNLLSMQEIDVLESQKEIIGNLQGIISEQAKRIIELSGDSTRVIISKNEVASMYNGIAEALPEIQSQIDTSVVFSPYQKGQVEIFKRISVSQARLDLLSMIYGANEPKR